MWPSGSFSFRSGSSAAAGEVLARALAGAGVGARALAADRQALPVPEATEATEVHQALDALLYLAPGVALDLAGRVDRVADRLHVAFAELVHLLRLRDLGDRAELAR